MRVFEKLQKNLVFALAFLMVLSSLGGASGLTWVHDNGSLCYICPLDELAADSAGSCCAPAEPTVSAVDCQSCCEARESEQSPRRVLPASVAVLVERPVLVQLFRIQLQPLCAQRNVLHQAPLHSPPSLRAPPVCGRFSPVMRFL